jgi:hypothetical protein
VSVFEEFLMPVTYVPGKPNPYFSKHKYHGVPVYGSYQRIEEGRLHYYVGPAATVEKAIAVYVLTPEHLWAEFQTEAEDLIKVNGAMAGRWEDGTGASTRPMRSCGWPTIVSSGRGWRRSRPNKLGAACSTQPSQWPRATESARTWSYPWRLRFPVRRPP